MKIEDIHLTLFRGSLCDDSFAPFLTSRANYIPIILCLDRVFNLNGITWLIVLSADSLAQFFGDPHVAQYQWLILFHTLLYESVCSCVYQQTDIDAAFSP